MKDIKIDNILSSYDKIKESTINNNPHELNCAFYNLLFNLFALRESMGKKDTHKEKSLMLKDDSIFGALKCLYDIYKHAKEEDANNLKKISVFVYVKKYPYSYPYTYGKAFMRYTHLDEDTICHLQKEKYGDHFKYLYEKYLENKMLDDILDKALSDIKGDK
ncbi:MAG: hypothetical protein ACI4PF_01935 [Christensenellales bacterium]